MALCLAFCIRYLLRKWLTCPSISPLSCGETQKGGTLAGCRPFAYLHFGTKCLEARAGAPRSFPWPVVRQQYSARRSCWGAAAWSDRRPAAHLRIVAVGWLVPTCGVGVVRSFTYDGEVTAHPPLGSPRYARSRRYSVTERINSSHIPRTKISVLAGAIKDIFSNIFSCSPSRTGQTPVQKFCLLLLPKLPPDSFCQGSHRHLPGGPGFRANY